MIWNHHPLINFHGPTNFCQKTHPFFSAGCIQTIIRIIRITRIPPSSQRNYSRPLHAIASPKFQGDQATSLRLVPSSSVFCTEFTSLRIKCLMAPTLFSLAASRMSRPRIPFKSKICKRSDAYSLKARNQELKKKHAKDSTIFVTRRNPSVCGGKKSRLPDTFCMEKT